MWSIYLSNNVWRDFRLSISVLATVAGESFNGTFTAKIDLPISFFFYITIADADIESLKPLHTSFDKYLDHMLVKFEQKRLVRTIQIFWTLWQKMVNHFWQSVDAISEDVPVTEIIVWWLNINLKTLIFQCSKNYGSPTRVTRLKVASNIANPINLKEKRPQP